ncbi:MAG: hypothetical protein INR68_16750 [Methylobacterium mesophilicum]|nr:hypothetical protein [Methylobacterium mesophilicum]
MNAPARIMEDAARVFESEAMRAHRRSISIHCPNCDDVEMQARCEIADIRDRAASGMRRAQPAVAGILQQVSMVATDAVFAPLPASRLMRIRAALTLTMMAARDLERAQRDG